jgi:sulfatase modifying factor 1
LPAEITEFIAASRRAAIWRRLRFWGLVGSAPLAAAVVALAVWVGLVWWGVHQVEAEMKFVAVPSGCFEMGSRDAEAGRFSNEGPVHKVCLTSFGFGRYEVTQAQWRRVMIFPNASDPARFKDDRKPVENVNWYEAQRFLWFMSLFGHHKYRLPSEAEWEYAARGGTAASRYWGDDIDAGCVYENIADLSQKKVAPDAHAEFANCDDGYDITTAPTGSFKPNPFGLYDMLGNVTEWVEDCYVDNYRETPTDDGPNTTGPCTFRLIRGGSYKGRSCIGSIISNPARYASVERSVSRSRGVAGSNDRNGGNSDHLWASQSIGLTDPGGHAYSGPRDRGKNAW